MGQGFNGKIRTKPPQPQKPPEVRIPKNNIVASLRCLPDVKFTDQKLTSYAGLVIFQAFFATIGLAEKLKQACSPLDRKTKRFYSHGKVVECLILHLLIGMRKLRDMDVYRNDPLVKRTLGLNYLPSVPTMSRMLSDFDETAITELQRQNRELVISRLKGEKLARVTLDFDGSVLSTTRHAEGSAVGFNKKKKGARSYYPLFCTIAQTAQVFDYHHRSGNVHDSNGAGNFLTCCVQAIREALPGVVLEVRMDSAFFSDAMVELLESLGVEYTISVPFERFADLKAKIENRKIWLRVFGGKNRMHYFEQKWKPDSWKRRRRFLFIRTAAKVQRKGPLQLDLFQPVEEQHDYKVIVSNKSCLSGSVVKYHEGRGSQEKIFGEIKTQTQMDYIPARKRVANEVYLLSSLMAHNLCRELQMRSAVPERKTTAKRAALWIFEEMGTLRRKVIQRAGRITHPQGRVTLTMAKNPTVQAAMTALMPS